MKIGRKFKGFLVACLVIITLLPIHLALAAQVPRDFYLEVCKGNIPGHTHISKSGQSTLVNATWSMIWENNTCYPWAALDAAIPTYFNISSTDVDDAAGGTGAWNVTIIGLDHNWEEINETVQLNGRNGVLTANNYTRVNYFYMREAGSSYYNEGTIYLGTGTITAGVPAAIFNIMAVNANIGVGRALSSLYTVPVNHTAFLINLYYISPDNKAVEFGMHYRVYGEGFVFRHMLHVFQTDFHYPYPAPLRFEGRTDIWACARVSTGAAHVSCGYDIILVDNDVLGDATLDWSDGTTSGTTSKDPTTIFAILIGVLVLALFALVIRSRR